ncbi:MAG TPA: alpha/beta fold hydrolase [Solirubrobacteraceae bacterium]|jgi:pimeloyl-ACP methyl ester carboxylesterase|nr:alpha/beta fold hydrolase [Solirubrobacteraceae bacterium]
MPTPRSVSRADGFETWQVELHGHRVVYRTVGSGPPVVLIHGMINSSRHWRSVALALADRYTVIAPDLIGHGDSATMRGDYSLGAHAGTVRDLLAVLGIERATFVGHSLGGGVAMIFFYQFPERVERIALVSSGGLGDQVSPLLRTAAMPGASVLLALGVNDRVLSAFWNTGTRLRERGVAGGVHLQAIARALRPLDRPGARDAFLHTLRAVIDIRGQRVNAADRLYLMEAVPTLIVWGERDHTIPLQHGRDAHAAIRGSRFVTLPGVAHFPHLEDPQGLARAIGEWIADTEPAQIDREQWRQMLARQGAPSRPRAEETRAA